MGRAVGELKTVKRVKAIKAGARVLGIDDSPFSKGDSHVLVVGVVERANGMVDGVLSCVVEKDGDDATEKISEMVLRSRFLPQIQAVLLNSIMVGGFNVIDIQELYSRTGKPVIAVVRRKPDARKVEEALANVCCFEEKKARIKKAGEAYGIGGVYAQLAGASKSEAVEFLKDGKGIPEAVRLAHVIAGGVVRGESRGRA